jgi:hypothetical protein
MDDAAEAPTVNHVCILGHVNSVVDRDLLFRDGVGEVLGEASLELSSARGIESELAYHAAGLDKSVD